MHKNQRKEYPAVVVFSGGQDSATCLAKAIATGYPSVVAVTFDYGQRHRVEIKCAETLARKWGVMHRIINVAGLLGCSALIEGGDVSAAHHRNAALPASFVPARNALFLTIAHGIAQEIDARSLYVGVCETDYSGYPDCRDAFVTKIEEALNLGYQTDIRIYRPLMHLDKAGTFDLAYKLERLSDVVNLTHTCYNGDHETMHAWGYGCGGCPACKLRAAGWEKWTTTTVEGYHNAHR